MLEINTRNSFMIIVMHKLLQHYLSRFIEKPVSGISDCLPSHSFKLKTFFFIQFNVPFEIISLIETSQSIGGAKREYPGKTT